jgi:hypothetical protein
MVVVMLELRCLEALEVATEAEQQMEPQQEQVLVEMVLLT